MSKTVVQIVARTTTSFVREQETEYVGLWNVPTGVLPDDWSYMTPDEQLAWLNGDEGRKHWADGYMVAQPTTISETETGRKCISVAVKETDNDYLTR